MATVPRARRSHTRRAPQSVDPSWIQRMTAGAPIMCIALCTLGSDYKSTRASSPEGGSIQLHLLHIELDTAQGSHCSRVIAYSQTSRSKGVISNESPEPGYIVVSFIARVPNPTSGTSSIHFGLVPFFSHPHGICRYISTIVGAHRGACLVQAELQAAGA